MILIDLNLARSLAKYYFVRKCKKNDYRECDYSGTLKPSRKFASLSIWTGNILSAFQLQAIDNKKNMVLDYTPFYRNIFYKNIGTEICEILKEYFGINQPEAESFKRTYVILCVKIL